jgi:hypothetical protein
MKNTLMRLVTNLDRPNLSFVSVDDGRLPHSRRTNRQRVGLPRKLKLSHYPAHDLASGLAYLVLAGSLFASLLEFLAAVP